MSWLLTTRSGSNRLQITSVRYTDKSEGARSTHYRPVIFTILWTVTNTFATELHNTRGLFLAVGHYIYHLTWGIYRDLINLHTYSPLYLVVWPEPDTMLIDDNRIDAIVIKLARQLGLYDIRRKSC